jgi:nucleotide-binding universal stress UspA family protein
MAPALLSPAMEERMTLKRATIHRILCPTDFSAFSERALARAMNLARWFRAEVTALHSIPFAAPPLSRPTDSPGPPSVFLAERRPDVEECMRALKSTFATEGVPLQTVIVEGDPTLAISACSNELPADLIVMGTHGKGGFNRLLMGSTAERVVRRVECPVLTIGPHDLAPSGLLFRKILCAVDLTTASPHTLETALSFAEENLASVTLIHVAPKPAQEWAPIPLVAANNADFEQALRAGGSTNLTRLIEAHPSNCAVRPRIQLGVAWREIVRVATDEESDLIVVGAHSDRTLGPWFVGSTAAQVVRHAPCPVLIVRERPARERS